MDGKCCLCMPLAFSGNVKEGKMFRRLFRSVLGERKLANPSVTTFLSMAS